ncbi:MAG: flagellar basal body P-ring protein FlgI [Kofleriaceae bacterium]|nr:flagellar basal body P-ring protein FlgI [Kofleriaceae bacterium]MCB9574573.1 flagellar basal body P-ring protein FlgI [Kofleriaceae bacterium]
MSHRLLALATAALAITIAAPAAPAHAERLKDLVDVEGVRDNQLVGYGLVVGLAGTGDDASSAAVRRPLAALMKKLGVTVAETELKAKNVAAVLVTADLPPFARPGQELDVLVSSTGSAKSLAGGTLIATPLRGADLEVYAVAQGPLTVGGFAAEGATGSSRKKNHVTVGRLPEGATVERAAPGALDGDQLTLVLRDADFTTARRIAEAIDAALGAGVTSVADPGAVTVAVPRAWRGKVAALVAELEPLEVVPDAPARIVIDERTGTIVVGAEVRLGAAAIAHGGLHVTVDEARAVSQPGALSGGASVEVPETTVDVQEDDGRLVYTAGAPTVADLATALDALGAKPRDLVAIFQALRTAGALRAEVVIQ